MAVLSLSEVPALRALVEPLGYTVHVRDACGGQAFSLEPLAGTTNAAVYPALESFFAAHRMQVHFYDKEKLNFIAK